MLAACFGAITVIAVPALQPLRFAYAAPQLHVALETGTALIGILAAAIIAATSRNGIRLDRLAIAAGLSVMAITSAVLTGMLAVAPDTGPRGVIAIAGTLIGAMLLVGGAFLPAWRPPVTARTALLAVVAFATLAFAVVVAPIDLALGDRRVPLPEDLARPQLTGTSGALALQIAIMTAMVAAAVGLTRRGTREGDAFVRRVGLAVTFYVFAKAHYVLLPVFSAEFLHVGDILRLLFCAVVLWAAVREVAGALEDKAIRGERSRIARDLHDGVAQELAYIRRRATQLEASEIAGAAERALLDSRWAIEHLARAPGEPLDRILRRHAAVIGARSGVTVNFSSAGTATAAPEVTEALTRILGEAVSNAGAGQATRVSVELTCDPLRLRVIDDGAGFDPAAPRHGFGLRGMQARAELVGADLNVVSGPGAGTEVAVELR